MAEPLEKVKKSLQRKPLSDYNALELGKLPPQANDLEEAVIGAVMLERDAFDFVGTFLKPECFYTDAHQRIWRACRDLHDAKKPIDVLTVTEQLKKSGELETVGGPYALMQLTNKIGSSAHIEYHGRIIFEKYLQRQLITYGTEIVKSAYDDQTEVTQLVENTDREWQGLLSQLHTGRVEDLESVVSDAVDRIQDPAGAGIKSKHRAINLNYAGYGRGSLVIVGAEPGVGKSAFVVSEASHQMEEGVKVGVLNLEMTPRAFVARMLCNRSKISYRQIKGVFREKEDWAGMQSSASDWYDAQHWLKKHQCLQVDFTPGISIMQAMMLAKKWKRENGLDILYVDYIQLMTYESQGRPMNRDQEIGQISRRLKMLAKDLDIAVVALSALNRGEAGMKKRFTLSRLRESGNIGADADGVIFLNRPEMDFDKNEVGEIIYRSEEEQALEGKIEIIGAKNRDDATFTTMVQSNLGISLLEDLNSSSRPDHLRDTNPTQRFKINTYRNPTENNDKDDDNTFP